jgi:hypothetical protein
MVLLVTNQMDRQVGIEDGLESKQAKIQELSMTSQAWEN